jgi:tRNA-dihydrouridine synthase B
MPFPACPGERPLLLAPMESITDGPFRRQARRHGADLVYSEFVSAEGLTHGARQCAEKLVFTPEERPIAIQVFGHRVGPVVEAALRAEAAAPELIDLNFGCPARKVAGHGAGAALLRDPDLLEAMTRAVVAAVRLPVTAKIRLGWDEESVNAVEIAQRLERAGVAAIAVHARTRSQGFAGRADWSWITRVVRAVDVPVAGNGDVREPADAARMFEETGCAAVMIGRGALGNPWIFERARHYLETGETSPEPSPEQRVAAALEHLRDSVAEKGETRAVLEMRKHYRGYLRGLPGAARLRAALMTPATVAGVEATFAENAECLSRS